MSGEHLGGGLCIGEAALVGGLTQEMSGVVAGLGGAVEGGILDEAVEVFGHGLAKALDADLDDLGRWLALGEGSLGHGCGLVVGGL